MNSEDLRDTLISAQRVAHEELRTMILSGALQSGQPLRQEEIASRLGISRVPVREALNRLEIEGLVELKPRRGYFVTTLDIGEIEDIFEMRALLEAHAGLLATRRRTLADADAVDRELNALEAVTSDTENAFDFARFTTVNARFHELIYRASGRKRLVRQIVMLRDSVLPLVQIIASDKEAMHVAKEEHRLIAYFFRQGNAAGVSEICREHCARTGRELIRRVMNV